MTAFLPVRLVAVPAAASVAAGLSISLGAPIATTLLAGIAAAAVASAALNNRAHPATIQVDAQPDAAEPRLDELIESIEDPLLLVDRQIVTRANTAARALLGQHIVGEDIRLAIRHPAAADRLATGAPIQDLAPVPLTGLGEAERRWEMIVRDLEGGARLVRLRDSTGTYTAERMRVDFVANASHELRTPLATLLGFIETLQDQNAADDIATRSRFLNIMFGEAKRMQRLVDDLISLSRIEAEKFRVPRSELDLAPLVDEVCATIRSGMRDESRQLLVRAAPDIPPVIGDRIQLSQLLHNLIGNALKYGRAGTPVRIAIQNARGGMVRLSVSDEGDGIAPEHLPRLTERFYRVDPGRSRALGGTGLGLAIVKHIVERHRGQLEIRSEVGRGTAVHVLIPAAPEPLSSNCNQIVTEDSPNAPSER